MTATFGKLQNRTLELREGLNIIQAPNETGKSTWCAFLSAMLYGVNSRERDRAGFIADKNRFAPWSGGAMSGRLDCLTETAALTVTRTTRRQTAPMGEFQAVYQGTGDEAPDLTGQTCGEVLLGVSREVFERSAFIRQSGLAISQDAGLERRIAALISSGEEETSYSEAAESLKKQLNRRRHNKTGQLPALEADLQETARQLEELSALEAQLAEARGQTEALTVREAALREELALHDRWAAREQQQALQQAEASAVEAEHRAGALRQRLEEERIPENESIGRLRGAIVNLETVRKAVNKARDERDAAMKAVLRAEAAINESPFAGQSAEEVQRAAAQPSPKKRLSPALLILGLLWLTGAAAKAVFPQFLPAAQPPLFWTTWGGLALLILAGQFLLRRREANAQKVVLLKRFSTSDPAAIAALADTYYKLLETRDAAQINAAAKSASADALYASLSSNEQGILLEVRRFAPSAFDIPAADALLRSAAARRRELAEAQTAAREARLKYDVQRQQFPEAEETGEITASPARIREETAADLSGTQTALAAARSGEDHLAGRLHALGDPVALQSRMEFLSAQRQALEDEYDSIRLALEALDSANTTLQNRFSPALGRRAAEIFAGLTGGRYSGVVLDRSFHLSAEPAGEGVYRDAALLSAGAADQLYLAVRLAICDLVLPGSDKPPIVLDDALSNFDDGRCAAALDWLKEAAKGRQILLFTCHSREADHFAGDGEVSVQRLTADL